MAHCKPVRWDLFRLKSTKITDPSWKFWLQYLRAYNVNKQTGDKVGEQGHNVKEMPFIMINDLPVI